MKMTKLPEIYAWLAEEKGPRILIEALKEYGVLEGPSDLNNPKILGWAEEIGPNLGMDYTEDSVPWCGLFMAVIVKRAGYAPPSISIRASSWDTWGNDVGGPHAPGQIGLGDVLRFQRPGGGHVGLYIGQDSGAYHVLGGNQSDAVSITRISRGRLVEARRCPWKISQPHYVRPIFLSHTGTISHNEL